MKGTDSLSNIKNKEYIDNIRELTDCFINQIDPLKVILFGSFANGLYTKESDFDFYILVDDGCSVKNISFLAYKSIRDKMKRPVDIVVGTKSRFEQKQTQQNSLMIESEVLKNGIVLYERAL